MHKDFTHSDPQGSFTWIHPVSVQREYFVPPDDHNEAIALFKEHPDFEKLRQAYREACEPQGGTTDVRDAVRSGLKRVEDAAESIRRELKTRSEDKKNRGTQAPA